MVKIVHIGKKILKKRKRRCHRAEHPGDAPVFAVMPALARRPSSPATRRAPGPFRVTTREATRKHSMEGKLGLRVTEPGAHSSRLQA